MEDIKHIFGKLEVTNNETRNVSIMFSKVEDGKLWTFDALKEFFTGLELYSLKDTFIKKLMHEIKFSKNQSYEASFERTDEDLKIKKQKQIALAEEQKRKREEIFIDWEPLILPKDLLMIESAIKTKIPLVKYFINPLLKTKIGREKIKVEGCLLGYVEKDETVAIINLDAPEENKVIFICPRLKLVDRKLIATESGIIRRGKNWADLVPFTHPNWTLTLTKDNMSLDIIIKDLYITEFIPHYSDIASYIKDNKPEFPFISKEKYAKFIRQRLQEKTPDMKEITFNVTEFRAGVCNIVVSEDKMSAVLKVAKGCGEENILNVDRIMQEVATLVTDKKAQKEIELKVTTEFFSPIKEFSVELLHGTGKASADDLQLNRILCKPENDLSNEKAEIINTLELQQISIGNIAPSDVTKMYMVSANEEILSHIPFETKAIYDIYGELKNPELKKQDRDIHFHFNILKKENIYFSKIDGILLIAENDKSIELTVIEHRDATMFVKTSEDYMEASVTYLPYILAGKRYQKESDIDDIIKKAGLVESAILTERVKEVKLKIFKNEPIDKPIIIAQGQAPTHGSVQELVLHETEPEKDTASFGKTSFKGVKINFVKKGQLVATLNPYRTPKNGFDVLGHTVPANEGLALEVTPGENIERDETQNDNMIRFYAKINGRIDFQSGVLDIIQQYVIDGDVGPRTGNINFTGDVIIKGSVMDNFKVFSTKDIAITGDVNASMVISKQGSVTIEGGFLGHGKGIIKAKTGITASFSENGNLLCAGRITIKRAIINTVVKCQDEVFVEEGGKIMGGTIYVAKKLEADIVGSQTSPTEVHFGQDFLIYDKIVHYESQMEKIRTRIIVIDRELKDVEKDEEKKKLEAEKEHLVQESKDLGEKYVKAKRDFNHSIIPDAKVIVKKMLNQGSDVICANVRLDSVDARRGCIITFDPDKLKLKIQAT